MWWIARETMDRRQDVRDYSIDVCTRSCTDDWEKDRLEECCLLCNGYCVSLVGSNKLQL